MKRQLHGEPFFDWDTDGDGPSAVALRHSGGGLGSRRCIAMLLDQQPGTEALGRRCLCSMPVVGEIASLAAPSSWLPPLQQPPAGAKAGEFWRRRCAPRKNAAYFQLVFSIRALFLEFFTIPL